MYITKEQIEKLKSIIENKKALKILEKVEEKRIYTSPIKIIDSCCKVLNRFAIFGSTMAEI